jgi:flagellar protein FlaJ
LGGVIKIELKKMHIIGFVIGLVILVSSLFLYGTRFFFFVTGIGILIAIVPFMITIIIEARIANEKEKMFIEFSRNLVESVKTGTPINRSIVNLKSKSYGVMSENVEKLANQISLGIPLNVAFQVFSSDVNNKTVSRALTLIGQAEKAGGDIGEILESVAEAVSTTDKLKKERRAAISTLVIQGYIIFVVFLIIILVMQFKILPMLSGITSIEEESTIEGPTSIAGLSGGEAIDQGEISTAFLYLLLAQGFFSGLVIGKLAEGNAKAGIKHSFALMLMSFLVSAGANLIFL